MTSHMTMWTKNNIITLYLPPQHHANRSQRILNVHYIRPFIEVGLTQIVAATLKRRITRLHFVFLAKDARGSCLRQSYDSSLKVVQIADKFPTTYFIPPHYRTSISV